MIMEKCVKKIGEDIIVGDIENLKSEIENDKEIKRFGHKLGEYEVERRFAEFEKWFYEINVIRGIKNNTVKYFKELLYLEETIANEENKWRISRFQREFKYNITETNRKGMYKNPWNNEELTQDIIRKFIENRQFALIVRELEDDKFEILSSDRSEIEGEENYETEKSTVKLIKQKLNQWGIWADEVDIVRLIRLGFQKHLAEIELWEKYQKIQDNTDE